jgi:hypothetical protein
MATLEKLTLNGAMTLLTYLQYSGLEHEQVRAEAVAAALCEMLTQLEADFPGYAEQYGWTKVASLTRPAAARQTATLQHSLEQDVSR